MSASAIFLAAFLATAVAALETVTPLRAVALARGWRPALMGAAVGFALSATLVLLLWPVIHALPQRALHLLAGLLLLLFGAGRLRTSILREAGRAGWHDLHAPPDAVRNDLARRDVTGRTAGIAAFEAVRLKALEVAFVTLALGWAGTPRSAVAGAALACALVLGAAVALRRPSSAIPDILTFWTGVTLTACGTYWTAEGLGWAWPLGAWALVYLVTTFAALGGGLVRRLAPAEADP